MAFGLSSTGFERKRLSDIKAEIEESLKTTFGPYINLLPGSVFSNIVGIIADREAAVWELAEDVYNSQYPDTAEGAALDNAVALNGLIRLGATKSRVLNQALYGTNGTLIPAGTIFSVSGSPTSRFLTDADVTLGVGVNEVQDIDFSLVPDAGTFKIRYKSEDTSAIPYSANAAAIQSALNALNGLTSVVVTGDFTAGFTITFTGVDGKIDQPILTINTNSLVNGITPVSVTVVETTMGTPDASVNMTAENTGEIYANAETLTVIETPISGLGSTRNPLDALVGREIETDIELRARRLEELQVAGAGTPEAIRSRVLTVLGVTDVIVFENISLVTDGDGRPAKSYEVVVNGGEAQEIVDMLWQTKPAGILTYGNQSGTALDSLGTGHAINWSRPTEVDIYLEMDITVTSAAPTNAATLVRDALVAYGNTIGIGNNVIVYPRLVCAVDQFTWLVDMEIRIDRNPAPTSDDNVAIAVNEIPSFDTSRTTVTVLP